MGFYIFTFTLHRLYYIVIQMIAMKKDKKRCFLSKKYVRFFPYIPAIHTL